MLSRSIVRPYLAWIRPSSSKSGGPPPDFEELGRIQAKYGLTMDRDSIGPLSERHGLTA